jgi:hypothetical protein
MVMSKVFVEYFVPALNLFNEKFNYSLSIINQSAKLVKGQKFKSFNSQFY